MSTVRGTISVDVAFTDSTTVGGAQSLKTITLRDAVEYTSGKVAVVTGTVGTTAVTINAGQPLYKDASGVAVQFSLTSRLAFVASGPQCVLSSPSGGDLFLYSSGNMCLVDYRTDETLEVRVNGTAGTASYTLVLYGT